MNNDGLADFEVQLVVRYRGGTDPWAALTDANWTLVAKGNNTILSTPGALTPGQTIDPVPTPPALWQSTGVVLFVYSQAPAVNPGILAAVPEAYVAVRFAAADGTHLGWLRFGKVPRPPTEAPSLMGAGWQPRAGTSLRVGEQPPPPTPTGPDWITQTPLDLSGTGTLDFVLQVKRWTNKTDQVAGVSVTLTPTTEMQVLTEAGDFEGGPVLYATAVPERQLIPDNPPAAAQWRGGLAPITLLELRRPAGSSAWVATGPLAQRLEMFIAVRRATTAGWIQVDAAGRLLGRYLLATGYPAAGEPPLARGEGPSDQRLDIDGDGLIDYVIRSYGYSTPGVYYSGRTLIPLGGNQILLAPNPPEIGPPQLIRLSTTQEGLWAPPATRGDLAHVPASPLTWRNSSIEVSGTVGWAMGSQFSVVDFPVGVRFASLKGAHLGLLEKTLEGAVQVGYFEAQATAPPAAELRVQAGAERILLAWPSTLSTLKLEATSSLGSRAWVELSGVVNGVAAFPLDSDRRFFRLRGP